MSTPMKLVLIYDEDTDHFYPLEAKQTPDPEENTYLIVDEEERLITLSFPPKSTLIEKRTIERRVSSFRRTGYAVPGKEGLRIGANFTLKKVDPKSDQLPDVLLTHGHTFGKSKLVRDEVPEYVEKEPNYEVASGSAGSVPDRTSSHQSSQQREQTPAPAPKQEKQTAPAPTPEPRSEPKVKQEKQEFAVPQGDEQLFVLGQFVDMLLKQGNDTILVTVGPKGNYLLKTASAVEKKETVIEPQKSFIIEGTDLFEE